MYVCSSSRQAICDKLITFCNRYVLKVSASLSHRKSRMCSPYQDVTKPTLRYSCHCRAVQDTQVGETHSTHCPGHTGGGHTQHALSRPHRLGDTPSTQCPGHTGGGHTQHTLSRLHRLGGTHPAHNVQVTWVGDTPSTHCPGHIGMGTNTARIVQATQVEAHPARIVQAT